MKKSVFIIIFLILFNFFLSDAQAINLIIEEGKVRLSILPGQTKSGTVNIKNTFSEPIEIKAYLEDWYYLPVTDGTKEFKAAGTTALSCASWISFAPAEFTIPAYGKQVVNYTVKVPKGVSGGHYAVLFFESTMSKANPEEGVGVGVAIRMGSLFYIEPEGTIKREIRLGKLSVDRELEDAPLNISLDFKNTGNVDITAAGTFHIIDVSGMVYARGEFNKAYTFAGDAAKLVSSWKESIPKGRYDLILTIDIGKALEEAGLGRGPVVTKEAGLEIGERGQIIELGELK